MLTIGIVLYQNEHFRIEPYCKPFFDSLKGQTFQDFQVLVLDNGSPDQDFIARFKQKYPSVQLLASPTNTGYGTGHNILIREALKLKPEFHLILNIDMLLDPTCIEEMMNVGEQKTVGIVGSKSLRWDFETYRQSNSADMGKTDTIDLLGLSISFWHSFGELGRGQKDSRSEQHTQSVFGVSGSCMLIKTEALDKIRYEKEYFDECMFMYKEDIDLCYRIRWAGYECVVAPKAVLYHDRSIAHTKPFFMIGHKSTWVQESSYLNEKIVLYKNMDSRFPWYIRFLTNMRQKLKRVYAQFFAPHLIEAEKRFNELLPVIEKKKQSMLKTADPKSIVSYMKLRR